MNNERDIKGDINNLLKQIKASGLEDDFESSFDFYSYDQTDNKSLFTARALAKIAPKETPFVKHEVNEEALRRAEELIKLKEMYSIQSVNNFVLEQLGERESMKASELFVNDIEQFIKMMLIPVYSTNSSSTYRVSKLKNETFDCLKYIVDDYEILRRRDE